MRGNLTGKEKRWIMYDIGNSAFTLLVSTIMPIYFNYLAGNAGLLNKSSTVFFDQFVIRITSWIEKNKSSLKIIL